MTQNRFIPCRSLRKLPIFPSLITVVLIAGVSAEARNPIYGNTTSREVPSSFCVIHVFKTKTPGVAPFDEKKELAYSKTEPTYNLCSATLTQSNEVTTAAHCFTPILGSSYQPGDYVVRASCHIELNPESLKYEAKNWVWANKVHFTNQYQKKSDGNDVARLTLVADVAGVQAMPTGTVAEFAALEDNADCRIAGAGRNAMNTKLGMPLSAEINRLRVFTDGNAFSSSEIRQMNSSRSPEADLFRTFPKLASEEFKKDQVIDLGAVLSDETMGPSFNRLYSSLFPKGGMAPGDSGGPLYCRASSTSAWKIYAVNDAYNLSYNTAGYAHAFRSLITWTSVEASLESSKALLVP